MKRALKMHLISGNDLKTFLLHRTAFLCVSRFLRLASFGTVNALMIVISVTFQPLFSVIPEILCYLVLYGRIVLHLIYQQMFDSEWLVPASLQCQV